MYRLCGLKLSAEDLEALQSCPKECQEFVNAVKKKEGQLSSVDEKIQQLFQAVLKNDVKGVQKIVDSRIPREALFILKGYSVKISVHVTLEELEEVELDTKDMNVFELACATGSTKVAQFLVQELGLVSKRDMNISSAKMIQNMMFLYVPTLKKDLPSFEVSLAHIQCLSNQDIKDLLFLLKQVNWTTGIEALLKSRATYYMYSGLSHQEQNLFIWDAYCLPYFELDGT